MFRVSWFERLMGFSEESPEQVRENVKVEGAFLRSIVNGKKYSKAFVFIK